MSIYSKLGSILVTLILSVTSAVNPLPKALSGSLKYAGLTAESLDRTGCGQLVLVESRGSSGFISFYEKNDAGSWVRNENLTATGWVGKRGVGHASEGIAATPMGLYAIGSAFYTGAKPATGLNSFAITPDTYWVDDPNSAYYNKRVVGTGDRDWNSAENMYISAYRYGFVIEYNTGNPVPGAGSAFFFHVYGQPTDGCVGTDTSTVLAYLKVLDASKKPYILMV